MPTISTPRRWLLAGLLLACAGVPLRAGAQPAGPFRVGVILQGGAYAPVVEGLRAGLKELGLEDGQQVLFHVRDGRGDLKSVEAEARRLEEEKVDVIYAVTSSVTLATRRATARVPVVFMVGSDPVALGLVESYRRPGGRFTGVHSQFTDLTGKRLELLKEMIPGLRKAVTFYNPDNPSAQRSLKVAREAAGRLNVTLVERPVATVEALRAGLRALRPGEFDALVYVAGAMVSSQTDFIVEITRAKKLPTMLQFEEYARRANGALASYGVSFYQIGRASAKQVERVFRGVPPGELPVEQVDTFHLVVNRGTARALGLKIPQAVLARANEVID